MIQGALEGFDDKVMHPKLVMTAYHGANDVLIANAARLYIPDGAVVLDCTYAAGAFWRRTQTDRFTLIGSDILPVADVQADFRQLPYRDGCADVLVVDPPYVHSTTQPRAIHSSYANNETTPGLTVGDILELYRGGLAEAMRVLRPGGLCWVKCQDQVSASKQSWFVVDIYQSALALGFYGQDMFVLTVASPPGSGRGAKQQHARRNHSYLWVFAKGRMKDAGQTACAAPHGQA